MNERIEKLFGQALDQAVPETWTALTPAQLSKLKDKFAELIVRECAEFVDYRLTNPDGASMAWCDGSDIKQHFGVDQ